MGVKPVLLRPECALADAMEQAAEQHGVSRQAWMLGVLRRAVEDQGIVLNAATDADDPLPGT